MTGPATNHASGADTEEIGRPSPQWSDDVTAAAGANAKLMPGKVTSVVAGE